MTTRRTMLTLLGAGATAAALPTAARAQAVRPGSTQVLIDPSSFGSYSAFESRWNYLYPWGNTHNGSAKMIGSSTDHSHISLSGGVLTLAATPVSGQDSIHYYSGTVYAKSQLTVSSSYPVWELRGDFQASSTRGTWPAFWATGVNSWPPESDVLEYKGTAQNWFNTYKNTSGGWSNTIVPVGNPTAWHTYRAVFTRSGSSNVTIQYYLDGTLRGTHTGANFVDQPMWIIIDLQMEGSSGSPGPTGTTYYRARNLYLSRSTG